MNVDEKIMKKLLSCATKSFFENEIPVAAAILNSETNELVSVAGNNRQQRKNVLGHAEINCILEAESKIGDWRLDGYFMIVSLEPCDMCSMIIKESRLDKVYYFLPKKQLSTIDIPIEKEMLSTYDEYKEKFNELLTTFFDNKR